MLHTPTETPNGHWKSMYSGSTTSSASLHASIPKSIRLSESCTQKIVLYPDDILQQLRIVHPLRVILIIKRMPPFQAQRHIKLMRLAGHKRPPRSRSLLHLLRVSIPTAAIPMAFPNLPSLIPRTAIPLTFGNVLLQIQIIHQITPSIMPLINVHVTHHRLRSGISVSMNGHPFTPNRIG